MAVRRFRRPGDEDAPAPRLRLFCFPHAGAGAALFRTWPAHLPRDVEVVCPCLPGRDARAAESPLADIGLLVRDLAGQISDLLDRPYALYGHSLGALVAFDLAQHLIRLGGPPPVRLIVSGQRGPSLPYPYEPIFAQPDAAFIAAVQQRHNAIPPALRADTAMMSYLTRVLRADFTLVETYRHGGGGPLRCPIIACGGMDDPMVGREQIQAWSRETTSDFRLRMLPGGHFFPQSHQAELLEEVGAYLNA